MSTFTYADEPNGHEPWEPTMIESKAKIDALPEEVQCSCNFFMSTTLALHNIQVPTRVEGYFLWLNELECWRANNPSAADWFSSHVDFHLSQLSVASTCANQSNLYAPHSVRHRSMTLESLTSGAMDAYPGIQPLDEHMYAAIDVDVGSTVFPTEDKLDFPVHGLTRREKVCAMICAEKHLDDIWRKIDLSYMKAQPIDGKQLNTLFETSPVSFAPTRTLMRTTPWQEPCKKVSVPTTDTPTAHGQRP
jgi:hypothetical protein